MASGAFYSDYTKNLVETPEYTGVGNSELHWHRKCDLDAFPPNNLSCRALAVKSESKGNIAALQLPPWKFDEKEFYFRTTRGRVPFMVSRMLANLGALFRSGFYTLLNGNCGQREFDLPNGSWRGLADPKIGWQRGYRQPEFKPDTRRKVRVPGYFDERFSDLRKYDGWFGYRLEFNLPLDLTASLRELYVGPVDDESWVWLNGKFLGKVT